MLTREELVKRLWASLAGVSACLLMIWAAGAPPQAVSAGGLARVTAPAGTTDPEVASVPSVTGGRPSLPVTRHATAPATEEASANHAVAGAIPAAGGGDPEPGPARSGEGEPLPNLSGRTAVEPTVEPPPGDFLGGIGIDENAEAADPSAPREGRPEARVPEEEGTETPERPDPASAEMPAAPDPGDPVDPEGPGDFDEPDGPEAPEPPEPGPAPAPSAETPENAGAADRWPWAEPIALAGAPGLARVAPGLYRGAQPTAEGFAGLRRMGVRTVVNLRPFHDDRPLLGDLPLAYENVDFNPFLPDMDLVARFLRIAADPERQPVFVHCRHGVDRTGVLCAVYRMAAQGWERGEAEREMAGGFGANARAHGSLVEFVRKVDVGQLRIRAGIGPGP